MGVEGAPVVRGRVVLPRVFGTGPQHFDLDKDTLVHVYMQPMPVLLYTVLLYTTHIYVIVQ